MAAPTTERSGRGLFLLDTNLGHRTVYENVKTAAASANAAVEIRPFDVHTTPELRWLRVPGNVRGGLVMRRHIRALVAERRPGYLVVNPHWPVLMCQGVLERVPTAIMLDSTPLQFDRLAYWDDPSDRLPGARLAKYRLARRAFHRAAALLPMSSWAAESLVKDYGVPRERIFVTPPGVDTVLWSPGERPARTTPEIAFVGGDFERKGGYQLLDWFRRSGRGRARLTLVTGAEIPAQDGVRVVRAEPNSPELRELVRSSDVFVLPTRADCTPHAVMEAMASGLPVVAGSVGGIPDLVEDGVTGYLVAPGDSRALAAALGRLLASESLRRAMGAAARERAVATLDSRRLFDRITAIGEAISRRTPPDAPNDWRGSPAVAPRSRVT